ncbi:MAG TPA: hypothetical protein VLB46_14480 [Pyrinomonadaceae bacterium]|nr:hypothetical protein [Pyrinomonadaceae bacterium]
MERKESISEDATSKDTLHDLEENEASVTGTSDDAEMPSPDGAFDESDELKKADPV